MSTIKQGITDLIEAKQALEHCLNTMPATERDEFLGTTGSTVESIAVDILNARWAARRGQPVRVSVPLD